MEKLFFWFTLLAPVSLFGQGYVNFANTAQTLFTTNGTVFGQGQGNMTGAKQWRVGLYVAPDGTTLESAFKLVAVATNSSISPGRFSFLGNPFNPPGNTGQPIAFLVRAWSLPFGPSYEAARAFYCTTNYNFAAQPLYEGHSPIGRVTPATGFNPAPTLFGTGEFPGQLTSGMVLVTGAPEESCGECSPRFSAIRVGGSNVTLRLERPRSADYCRYQLQVANSVAGPWTNLNAEFTIPFSGLELTDTNPLAQRFYRLGPLFFGH